MEDNFVTEAIEHCNTEQTPYAAEPGLKELFFETQGEDDSGVFIKTDRPLLTSSPTSVAVASGSNSNPSSRQMFKPGSSISSLNQLSEEHEQHGQPLKARRHLNRTYTRQPLDDAVRQTDGGQKDDIPTLTKLQSIDS